MKTGWRKFIWGITGLVVFLFIMLKNPSIDPFSLGLGIGGLLASVAVPNLFEHFANKGK